jgi:hypothetical protein
VALGQRCDWFEEAVLPLEKMVTKPQRLAAIVEAATKYRVLHKLQQAPQRVCPDCRGDMPPHKQLCPTCARRRRLKTYRAYNERRAQNGGQITTEVQKSPSFSFGKPQGILPFSPDQGGDTGRHQNGPTSVVRKDELLERAG